jgi:probable phosphoglycerate mutase
MTRLLLIRHGANDSLKKEMLVGWTPGVHLNQKGQAQAEALARRLAPVEIAAIYTSPLERATETAHIIAAPHELPVVVREGLGEVRFGLWSGESLDKLRRKRLWRAVQFMPSTMRFPGGESFCEVQARIVAELDALRVKHPRQTIAVVSHADVIKIAVAHYVGLHLDLFQRLVIEPASLTVLALGGPMPYLACMNDIGHLPPVVEGEST